MKTIRVRGVVGSEKESLAWDVYVDLCLDDDDKIVDYQQVEFGAAPPPPTGDYKLIFSTVVSSTKHMGTSSDGFGSERSSARNYKS